MEEKQTLVVFANSKIESEFESLKEGKFEDKKLYNFINRAIEDLKKNPFSGIKIPRKVWPNFYVQNYNVDNLWKYDLPNGWRIAYTIKANEVSIFKVILEWFDHKNYERRFHY